MAFAIIIARFGDNARAYLEFNGIWIQVWHGKLKKKKKKQGI